MFILLIGLSIHSTIAFDGQRKTAPLWGEIRARPSGPGFFTIVIQVSNGYRKGFYREIRYRLIMPYPTAFSIIRCAGKRSRFGRPDIFCSNRLQFTMRFDTAYDNLNIIQILINY